MNYFKVLEKHVDGLNGRDLLQTLGKLQESLGADKRAEDTITEALTKILEGNNVINNRLDFLRALPSGLKKRQIHDEYILKSIPESEWKYYRPRSWIEEHERVTANDNKALNIR